MACRVIGGGVGIQLVPGERFGRYVVEAELGRGGQAAVYRAQQVGTERSVALKVFHEMGDPASLQRFRREAVAAARVEHPRIVTVYESGDVDGAPFIAMRLVPGPSLAEVVARFGALSPHRAVAILDDVADAVDAAHRNGLVHRDIKPGNVLLDLDDRAYLSDFGVARLDDLPRLTRRGDWLGTVEYVSPEQSAGHPATPASDVYAFGVLAYELLVGRPPFVHRQASAVLVAHVREEPPPATALNPALPRSVDRVLARALAKSPGDRPASASEVVAGLRAALAGWRPPEPDADAAEPVAASTRVLRRVSDVGEPEGRGGTRVMPDGDATRVLGAAPASDATAVLPVAAAPPRRRRRGRALVSGAVASLALVGGGLAVGWVASDRASGAGDEARTAAYKQGFFNGKARGVTEGRKAGLSTGIAQGTRQGRAAGVAQGRRQGAAEARRVPSGAPGQYWLVRVGDDGAFTDFVGEPLDPGGCFSVDDGGDVRTFSSSNPFNPCVLLGSG
jgi:serine/threonine-protein kinase